VSRADFLAGLRQQAWNPAAAELALDQLHGIDRSIPEKLASLGETGVRLLNFLAFSPAALEEIRKHPVWFDWLSHADVLESKSQGEVALALDISDEGYRRLREWKSQEMLRIAFRELSGISDFVETTRDITQVAERCVQTVAGDCFERLSRRWGKPVTGFAILAMGKFGGSELNYSSDIDLIFFYGEDGLLNPRFTFHEFFTRLTEKVIEAFTAREEALFRIDLRLRPEGAPGPLVRCLLSLENYYAGYGETWERMALIKARGICGDEELFYEFTHRLQPFIFPRTVSADLLDEVADLKRRIERDILGPDELHRNVKLGYGGIREIEFTVQTLQLLHGARHAFLQEHGTLKTLAALGELGILPAEDVARLRAAYIFLRAVEHRLQIPHEQQTHTLPARDEPRALLARSLGFDALTRFDETLHNHTATVRSIFERLLTSNEGEAPRRTVDFSRFAKPEHARKAMLALREGPSNVHVAPRTRRLFSKLEPELIRWLSQMADPDAALNRFVRFVDVYGIRGLLFETLLTNPRLLELLARLFDATALYSEIVIRRPELIEEIARGKNLGAALGRTEFRAGLQRNEAELAALEWVRVYRRTELLRILLRDILGIAELEQLQGEMTALAEACLEYCQQHVPGAPELTVIAMGKFGGGELLYGADLDLVFIGNEPAPAEALIAAMSSITVEGRVFPIDARLRPEGESGMLVVTLESYENYLAHRAQYWELQALTKARILSGPVAWSLGRVVHEAWMTLTTSPTTRDQIAAMYERIVRERGKGPDLLQFKTGRGGLIAIEFLVQYLQIKRALREPNSLRTLRAIADDLGPGDAQALQDDYRFLRRVESVLRRDNNLSVSQLPAAEEEQHRLAIRLGFGGRDQFLSAYQERRRRIEGIVQRYLM
jgi:glutamate-ammonia-ligase adenylyltransferase